MTERRLTFIDCDENPLVAWLKEDRVQLVVIDSRPELAAGELRRFASALFATYVGAQLAARLEAARTKLSGVRDQLAVTTGDGELRAALDDSLAAIEDAMRVMTASTATASGSDPAGPPESPESSEPSDPPDPTEPPEPDPPEPPEPPMGSVLTAYDRFRKPKRAKRAGEGDGYLVWGWVRHRGPLFAAGVEPGISDAAEAWPDCGVSLAGVISRDPRRSGYSGPSS